MIVLQLIISFHLILASMSSEKSYKVFVYGTLKRGEPNHNWFARDESGHYKFICNAKTIEKYPLVIATKYNIPFLLYSPGTGHHVQGEIYEVDDRVLSNLDILEEHPSYYIREEYNVMSLDEDGKIIKAWIYFIKKFKPQLLEQQMFSNYSSKGSHGLNYVTSEQSSLEDLN